MYGLWQGTLAMIVFIITILLFCRCNDERRHSTLFVKLGNPGHTEWHKDSTSYTRFQRFNFFTLKGEGEVKSEPFVYVKESPDRKIIRMSDDVYNPYVFKNAKDYWYIYREMDMDIPLDQIPISGPIPRKIIRIIKQDTIYDYELHLDSNGYYPYLIRYTKNESYSILLPKVKNKPQFSEELVKRILAMLKNIEDYVSYDSITGEYQYPFKRTYTYNIDSQTGLFDITVKTPYRKEKMWQSPLGIFEYDRYKYSEYRKEYGYYSKKI